MPGWVQRVGVVALVLAAALPPGAGAAGRRAAGAYKTYLPLAASDAALPSSPTPVAPVVGAIGSMSAAADGSKTQTVHFPADGTAETLSVTDPAGDTWTLSIPGDALLAPRDVSMTPLSSATLSDPTLKLKGGVQFGPDGLEFVKPATLSVAPPSGTSGTAPIVLAPQDGQNVILAETTVSGNAASAPVWHFSDAGWGDPDVPLPWKVVAEHAYNVALANAQAFLKAPTPTPPAPPVHSQYCLGTAAYTSPQQQDDQYVAAFQKPYADVIRPLLGAARTLILLGGLADDSQPLQVSADVAFKAVVSARNQVTTYEKEAPPDHFDAVVTNMLSVYRQYELLSGNTSGEDAELQELGAWAFRVRDYYMDKLRHDHEYQAFPALFVLERNAILLSGNTSDEDFFFRDLKNAIAFQLTREVTADITTNGTSHVKNSGDILVKPDDLFQTWPNLNGSVDYTEGTFSPDHFPMVLPDTFTTRVEMRNFDPCVAKTADVRIDRFGADTESYTVPQYGAVTTGGTAQEVGALVFQDNLDMKDGGGWKFTVPVTDLNATMSDQTLNGTGSHGGASIAATLHVELVHKPQ